MATVQRDNSKSYPFFVQKVKLHSLHAQQVFDRGFEFCAGAIFTLSVVLRVIGTDQQAREVETVVDDRINKTYEDLRSEVSRLEKLAEANGIEFGEVGYSKPKDVEAKITSPRSARYLGLIREFDAMVAKFDILWLSGVLPDSNYSRSIYEWKRRLLRLAGQIRSITGRAMGAARRKGVETSNTNESASAKSDTAPQNDVSGSKGDSVESTPVVTA